MRAARLDKSPRLQRVFDALKTAGNAGLTTMEIIQRANVCAVNSIAAELKANGIGVTCTREGRTADGAAIYRYRVAG